MGIWRPCICIGMPFAQMETRLLLATILQRYVPRLAPGFPVVLQPRVTLRPRYGMKMIPEPAPVRAHMQDFTSSSSRD